MLKFLYLSSLFFLLLGQFSAIIKTEGTNFYLFDAVILFSTFIYLIYLLGIRKTFMVPKAFFWLFAFLAIGVISLFIHSYLYSSQDLVASAFYAVRYLTYFIFALCLFNLVRIKSFSKEFIYSSIVWGGLFLLVGGILQLLLLPDFETLDPSLGWDPHKNRLASTFFDPNFVGTYFVLSLSILFEKLLNNDNNKNKVISMVKILLLLVGVLLTFSRSAWLMLAVVVFMYGLFKKRLLLVLSILLLFTAYYAVPRIQTRISGTTDPADSAQFRLISWSNTLQIIEDNPVAGVGLNTLRYVQKDYGFIDNDSYFKHSAAGSDSSLLFVAATTGLIGLLVFLAAVALPIFKAKSFSTNFLYIVVISALIVDSQFINALFYPQIMFVWTVILAFSYL